MARKRTITPRADSFIIPRGVYWSLLYDRRPGINQVVAIAEFDAVHRDAWAAATRTSEIGLHVHNLHMIVLAGIPFRLLTPLSDPEVAQYITHHNARMAELNAQMGSQ